MATSLLGYGVEVFERDDYRCVYCGLDCRSFELWRFLTVDHLLPNIPEYKDTRESLGWKATACQFCNSADNKFFKKNEITDKMKPEEIIKMRLEGIRKTTAKYYKHWLKEVAEKRLKKLEP